MTKRFGAGILALLVLSLLGPGKPCRAQSLASAASGAPLSQGSQSLDSTIRIGGVAPLTGEAAIFGQACKLGSALAVEEWNAAGGVLGKTISLVFADDKGDPFAGAEAFSRLIKDERVVAVVGAIMSKVSLAGAPLAQASRIPMVSPTSTNVRVTQVGDYIFRACFIDPYQGKIGATFALENLQASKAAVIFDKGNDYATGLARSFRSSFVAGGGQVCAWEAHDSGTLDFRGQIRRIVASLPEVVYCPDYYNDDALIAKQLRELGYLGPIVGGDGWDSPDLVRFGGEAVENCFFTNHWAADDPGPATRDFMALYKTRYGSDPDIIAVLGYDTTRLLLDAIQRAGSTDGPAIRDALQSTDFMAVTGRIRFDESRNPVKSAFIIAIKDGAQVFEAVVEP